MHGHNLPPLGEKRVQFKHQGLVQKFFITVHKPTRQLKNWTNCAIFKLKLSWSDILSYFVKKNLRKKDKLCRYQGKKQKPEVHLPFSKLWTDELHFSCFLFVFNFLINNCQNFQWCFFSVLKNRKWKFLDFTRSLDHLFFGIPILFCFLKIR